MGSAALVTHASASCKLHGELIAFAVLVCIQSLVDQDLVAGRQNFVQ